MTSAWCRHHRLTFRVRFHLYIRQCHATGESGPVTWCALLPPSLSVSLSLCMYTYVGLPVGLSSGGALIQIPRMYTRDHVTRLFASLTLYINEHYVVFTLGVYHYTPPTAQHSAAFLSWSCRDVGHYHICHTTPPQTLPTCIRRMQWKYTLTPLVTWIRGVRRMHGPVTS